MKQLSKDNYQFHLGPACFTSHMPVYILNYSTQTMKAQSLFSHKNNFLL